MAQDGAFTGKIPPEEFYKRCAKRAVERAMLAIEGTNYVNGRYIADLSDAEHARGHAAEKYVRQAEWDVREGVRRSSPQHPRSDAPELAHEGLCSSDAHEGT